MGTEVATRFLEASELAHWTDVVAGSPDGSIYALPDYLDALCAAAGGSYRVLVAEHDSRILGGIAAYERRSRGNSYISPRPLLYYNGFVLAPHDSSSRSRRASRRVQVLAALERALSVLGHARLEARSRSTLRDVRVFQSQGWSVQPSYSYVVDISDLSVAWPRMNKNLRRLVNRCRDQGLELTADDDFDAFHRLHVRIHERKRAPLYLPREKFQSFFERLRARDLCRLYHARLPDGRVVASQLVLLGPHPVTHTVCAAADAEHLSLGASAFLRWRVFEDLSRCGYLANDLTDAELSPVTRFKSQLGGELALSLVVSRPASASWRAGEFAQTMLRGVGRRLVRGLRPLRGGKPR